MQTNNERTNNYLIIEPLQIFVGPIKLLKSEDLQLSTLLIEQHWLRRISWQWRKYNIFYTVPVGSMDLQIMRLGNVYNKPIEVFKYYKCSRMKNTSSFITLIQYFISYKTICLCFTFYAPPPRKFFVVGWGKTILPGLLLCIPASLSFIKKNSVTISIKVQGWLGNLGPTKSSTHFIGNKI